MLFIFEIPTTVAAFRHPQGYLIFITNLYLIVHPFGISMRLVKLRSGQIRLAIIRSGIHFLIHFCIACNL